LPTSPNETMKRIFEFDGLRTLAVLIVIADHYAPFRNFAGGATARLGGFGVDVFFVLSGFLITTILLELKGTDHAYQVFYARRFLRILPPFVALLVVVYGAGILMHEPLDKSKMFGQLLFLRSFKNTRVVMARVWGVIHGAAAVPGLFHKLSVPSVPRDYPWLPMSGSLGPTWSLSVEEWFYVLWAPVVLMFRRRMILIVAAMSCLMGFVLRWLGGGGSDFFSSVDILIVGAVLALWVERRKSLPLNVSRRFDNLIRWAALVSFLLFLLLTWLHRDLISRTLVEIFVFGAIAWLIRNAGCAHPISSLLRVKPLVYSGMISYTIYLIHLPMYFLVRSALHGLIAGLPEVQGMWIVALFSLAGTLAFSAISWRYYEQPLLGFKDVLTERIKGSRKPVVTVEDPHRDPLAIRL
jgi:peptidoglycan/LPS O-acetylase OafA/YrhL